MGHTGVEVLLLVGDSIVARRLPYKGSIQGEVDSIKMV